MPLQRPLHEADETRVISDYPLKSSGLEPVQDRVAEVGSRDFCRCVLPSPWMAEWILGVVAGETKDRLPLFVEQLVESKPEACQFVRGVVQQKEM